MIDIFKTATLILTSVAFIQSTVFAAEKREVEPKMTFEQFWADAQKSAKVDKSPESIRKMQWWRDARLGMFIHWNMSSIIGGEISWCQDFYALGKQRPNTAGGAEPQGYWDGIGTKIPVAVYENLYKSFYPAEFNADKWVKMAKDAGMKYIIPVCKHHDGFAMWDTKTTDYNIMHTPFKRDIIGELAKATHKAGLKFGIYYSQRDWHHPEYQNNLPKYNEYMYKQVKELLTKYGQVDIIFWDAGNYPDPKTWESEKLFKMAYDINPNIIINDRCSCAADYSTPEQEIGGFRAERNWESNMTFTGFFSWHNFDKPVISFKELMKRVIYCAGGDGNLLMNIDPLPTGGIHPDEITRMAELGDWMRKYGDTIYATSGGPIHPGAWGACTQKGNKVYLHVIDWMQIPENMPSPGGKIASSSVLTGGSIKTTQAQDGTFTMEIAKEYHAEPVTVIELVLE